MFLKNALLVFILLLTFTVFGQMDSTAAEKQIYLKNQSNNNTSHTINKWSEIKIWLKGNDKPIKGFVSYLNDSTLLINEEAIAIERIEKVRITPAGGKFLGTVTTLIGSVIAGSGIVLMWGNKDPEQFADFLFFIAGAAITIVGVPIALIGTTLLIGNSKKYNLDEWEFQFENKKTVKRGS